MGGVRGRGLQARIARELRVSRSVVSRDVQALGGRLREQCDCPLCGTTFARWQVLGDVAEDDLGPDAGGPPGAAGSGEGEATAVLNGTRAAAEKRLTAAGWKKTDEGWLAPHEGKRSYRNDLGRHIYPAKDRAYSLEEALEHQDGYEAEAVRREAEAAERDKEQARGKARVRAGLGFE